MIITNNQELKKCYQEIAIKNVEIHKLLDCLNTITDKYLSTKSRLKFREKEVRKLNKVIKRLLGEEKIENTNIKKTSQN